MNTKLFATFVALAFIVSGMAMITPNKAINVATPSFNGGIPGNWTGTYSAVMNATEDVFILLGDTSTLLSEYAGTITVLAITLVIVAIMGVIPIAFAIGLFMFAFGKVQKARKSY